MQLVEILTTYKDSVIAAINATTYLNKVELLASAEAKFTVLETVINTYKTKVATITDTGTLLTLIKNNIVDIQTYTGMRNSLGNDELEKGKYNGAVASTSDSSVAIGAGAKTFTLNTTGLDIIKNQLVKLTNSMTIEATVTSYVGTSLVVSVTDTVGSGTAYPWTITKSGTVIGTTNTSIVAVDGATSGSKTLTVAAGLSLTANDVITLSFSGSMAGIVTSYSGDTLVFTSYSEMFVGVGTVGGSGNHWNVYTPGYPLIDIMPTIINPDTGLTDYRLFFTPWRTKLADTGTVEQLDTYLQTNILVQDSTAKTRYYKSHTDVVYSVAEFLNDESYPDGEGGTITNFVWRIVINGVSVYATLDEAMTAVVKTTFPLSDLNTNTEEPIINDASLYVATGRWSLTNNGTYGEKDGNGINLYTTHLLTDALDNNKPPTSLMYLSTDMDQTDAAKLDTLASLSFKNLFSIYLNGTGTTKEPFINTFKERSRYFSLGGATAVVYKKSPKDIMLTEFKLQEVIDYYGFEIPGL